jgi:hypothetical protein
LKEDVASVGLMILLEAAVLNAFPTSRFISGGEVRSISPSAKLLRTSSAFSARSSFSRNLVATEASTM